MTVYSFRYYDNFEGKQTATIYPGIGCPPLIKSLGHRSRKYFWIYDEIVSEIMQNF